MQLCFIDEAGDLGVLRDPPAPNDQPVLVVGGLFVDAGRLPNLTHSYLDLKHRFFPNLDYPSDMRLDRILPEIKGAELRKHAIRGNARQRRHAIGFLDRITGLLWRHDARVVARVWIKAPGSPFDGTAVYTSSIQGLCTYFEHYLTERDSGGLCIADSRNKSKNLRVSHSIFTQKFSTVPNYGRLVELPTFGHSDNHAGLQICDIVCSALLYPIACYAYCTGHVSNVHVQPGASRLRRRYGQQLKELQHRYCDVAGGSLCWRSHGGGPSQPTKRGVDVRELKEDGRRCVPPGSTGLAKGLVDRGGHGDWWSKGR